MAKKHVILFTTAKNNRLFGESGTDSKNTNMNNKYAVEGLKYLQSLKDSLGLQNIDLSTAFTKNIEKKTKRDNKRHKENEKLKLL